ncbi:MAG: cardiolipin synthase [Muribaculaceae bacterium]|nr:cardiolipin synthase [Muribaculaceae bacterium]
MWFPETIHLRTWFLFLAVCMYFTIIILSVVVVLKENRNPIRALSWVIALIFLPGVGLIFYLFFGRSLRGEMLSQKNKRRLQHSFQPYGVKPQETELRKEQKNLVMLGSQIAGYPLTFNNEVDIIIHGEEKFKKLKEDLSKAQKSIYLQYYIFLDDKIGTEIAEILISKARAGVEVKVIYDHVGSFSASNSFFKKMEAEGIEVHPFFRVNFPQLANRINWRNHRKIVVVDGEIGYIGGMNIADRYAYGNGKNQEIWRDTHFRVKGDIVESLIHSFLVDWNFRKKDPYFPQLPPRQDKIQNEKGIQLVTGGPISTWDNLSLMFLKAISSAKRLIWIQTPYFLPTDALFNALQAAALSNIDVRIMMPAHTDSLLLHYASFSYISQCLAAGIKIYLYQPGMLHAKSMVIDDDLVTAGSTNFDFRSFENNFECNLFIHDAELNSRMRDIFYSDMKECIKIRKEEWKKRPIGHRFLESLLRLVSPIL